MSNPTDTDYGAISVRVISSTNSGLVGTEAELQASLPSGDEALFTSQDIENKVGNFGRADLEVSVEGTGAYVTRLIQRPDGTFAIDNR